jgi:hypothetical protein
MGGDVLTMLGHVTDRAHATKVDRTKVLSAMTEWKEALRSTERESTHRRYDDKGWRATFFTTEMAHSPTSATGTGWERTPWCATQRAAWEALRLDDAPSSLMLVTARPISPALPRSIS